MYKLPRLMVSLMAAAGSVVVATFAATNSMAQEFPNKPIRMIVANSPGSTHDLMSRIIGEEMRKVLDQTIVIENRPGAGQMLGYEYVARQAPADGYTIATVAIPTLSLAPVTVKNLRFDPLNDLTPVVGLVETRYILVSPSKAPWKSFKDMVTYAKANPGKLNYGSSSQVIRIMMEVLMQNLGMDIARIDYNGGGPILQAIMSGDVHTAFLAESAIKAGGDRMQVIASTGERRRPPIMEVPTLAELGFPQLGGLRYTLSVRTGTPKVAMQKLYDATTRALEQPDLKARLTTAQLEVWHRTPEVAYKTLQDEARMYAEMAKKLGLQPQ